jgi:hypothetical protein
MRLRDRFTAACAMLMASALAAAAPADEVKALLDKGDAAGAYALAKRHPDQLGNPAFDFFFGVAAIDSGRAGEGVLALERYVVNFPDNLQARLELARGYFVLGENQRAREEFSGVLRSNPPRDVVANIDRYLDAIRARESSYRTTAGAYVEFGIGHDSNINGGVSNANISLPNFGLVTLAPSGVRIDRNFAQIAAGANVVMPVSPGFAVFGSVSGDSKMHEANREFDQRNVGAAGGLSYLLEKDLFRATISYGSLDVDYRRFRDVVAVAGEWMHQKDELQAFGASLQIATLDYAGGNDVRNARLYGIGGNYRRALIGPWRPLLTFGGSYAVEENRRSRDDLGRDIYTLRAGFSGSPAARWSVGGGLGVQYSRYQAQDPLFSTARKDRYLSLDGAIAYAFSRSLSLRGELLLSENRSNLDLYDYRRDVFAVKIRYEAK